MEQEAIQRLPFEDARQASKLRRKQQEAINSAINSNVNSDVKEYESNINYYEQQRQEYIDALNKGADEATLQKEQQEYINASQVVEDKSQALADKWGNKDILNNVDALKAERETLNQAKEQVISYNQQQSQTTKLGRSWKDLQDPTKYDIIYNADGSIASIKSKPVEYSKKIDGTRELKDSYTPNEVTFDSNGNILSEVERDIYRTKSGDRKKFFDVYETQSAEYSNGYLINYVDKDALGETKKEVKTLTREEYEAGVPIKKFQYKYDSKGNRRSELFTDYKTGKIDYDDLGETKQTTEEPVNPNKLVITPTNLFGTSNNKLELGDIEQVSSQALRKMGKEKSMREYSITEEQYNNIVNNQTESLITFQEQEDGIKPVDFRWNQVSQYQTEVYNSIVSKQIEQAKKDALLADIKKLNWIADPERLKAISEKKELMLSDKVSWLNPEDQKTQEALQTEEQRPDFIKNIIQTNKEIASSEGFTKTVDNVTITYKPRFFKYAYGIASETVKDTYDLLNMSKEGVRYVLQNPVETSKFIIKSNQAALNFAYKLGQDQVQGIKEKGLIGQYKSNYEFNKNLATGAVAIVGAVGVSQLNKARKDKGLGIVSEVGSFVLTSVLIGGAIKGVSYGGKFLYNYADDVGKNIKQSYNIWKFNKANKGQIVVYDQVKNLVVRDTGLSTQVAVRPVLSGASKASGITLKEGQTFEQGMIRFKLGNTQYINPNELPKTNAIAIVGKRETVYTPLDDLMKVRPTTLRETPKGFTEIDDVAYFSQKQLPYSKGSIIKSEPIKSVKVTEDIKGLFDQKKFFKQLGKLEQEGDDLVFKGFTTYQKTPVSKSVVYGQRGLFNIYPTQAKATVSIFDKSVATVDDAINPGYWRFWNKGNNLGTTFKAKELLKDAKVYPLNIGMEKAIAEEFIQGKQLTKALNLYVFEGLSRPRLKDVLFSVSEPISSGGIVISGSSKVATESVVAFNSIPNKKKIIKTFKDYAEKDTSIVSGGSRQQTVLIEPETKKESILAPPETKQETKKVYEVSSGSKTENIFKDKRTKTRTQYQQAYYNQVFDTKPILTTEQIKTAKSSSDIIAGIKGNRFKTYIGSLYDSKLSNVSGVKYDTTPLYDTKLDIKQDTKLNTDSLLRTDSKIDVKTDTKLDMLQKTKPKYDSKLDLKYDFNYRFEPKDPFKEKPPKEEPPKPPKFKFYGGDESLNSGFNAEVKAGNKWLKVNRKPLTFTSALAEASEVVDNTSARSFRITKAKGKPEESGTLKSFNPDKFTRKKSGVFIEKSAFAIDTTGEIQGITVKGWLANKSKALFSTFNSKKSRVFESKSKLFR
jgi:hypothetical protein